MTDEELAVDGEGQTDEAQEELSDDEIAMAKLKEAITVESEDLGGLRVKLTITVPQDTVDERMSEQFMELKREALIPGFRKGHAPMQLVEKRFAHDVGDELKGKLVGSGYLAAVEKEELKPLGDPMVWVKLKEERVGEDEKPRTVEVDKLVPFADALDHMKLPADAPMTFSCELEVKPDFDLPELEKIPVEKPIVTIDDEDVDGEVNRLQMMRGTFQPVEDGVVESNDMLYTAMKLTVEGEVIASEENYDVAARDIHVKGIPLTGLGDALTGRKVADTITFEATVPDDHENLDLRGKTAKFEFTIHEVKRLELPPIDETFLSNLGLETEDDLRKAVREGLEGRIERMIQTAMQEQIGAYLVENTKIEIPEGLSQRQTERSVARRVMDMYQSGQPQSEIAKEMDKLRAEARDRVVLDLKLFFILEKIAEEREIEVNEEQINGAIAQIAQRSNKRFDRVRDELSKGEGLTTLYLRLRDERVLGELLEEAEITEKERPKKKKQPAKTGKKSAATASKGGTAKTPKTTAGSAEKAAPKKTAKKTAKKAKKKS